MQAVMAFVFGSIVGSFLNVCIFRMPKDESIAFPPSHCTSCSKPIAWYDNIPIVSFLALRARCRHCQAKISWQYPLIEALTGALFVLYAASFGVTPKGLLYLYLTCALLVQTLIDFRHKIIPDEVTLPAIGIGLAVSAVFPQVHGASSHLSGFLSSLWGVLAGGGFLYLVGTAAEMLLKKEAMGGGDVKLLAGIGAVIGWRGVLWTVVAASFLGSAVGIYLKLKKGDELIPFGPFLAAGAVLYLFFGTQVTDWYFNYLKGI